MSAAPAAAGETRRAARDSLIVALGGQIERALGVLTTLVLRWGLDPSRLGVYTGLRLYLDNTNRSSLGIGLGAVQEIPILRAAGRHDEARRVADVAHTANSLTCLAYASALVVWAALRAPGLTADPLAAEWTWGLVAVAGLAVLQRHLSFLVAVLRAHGEFALTAELDVIEAAASAGLIACGLWLAGFWGLIAAVGGIFAVKILYLRGRHPLRLGYAWDWPIACRLLKVGLPILANTAIFGLLVNLDRMLILGRVADGSRAVGLYSVAVLGAGWGYDLAGRIASVVYTHLQTTLGRTRDPAEVARRAIAATEAQAVPLGALAAAAYVLGPEILGALLPRYAEGLPALRPLMPGMLLLGLAWPARQLLIALGRPARLAAATLAGLAAALAAGLVGAERAGIVGVARGMSIGFGVTYLATTAAAFAGALGARAWMRHEARMAAIVAWFAAGAAGVALATPPGPRPVAFAARGLMIAAWCLAPLAHAWRRHDWLSPMRRRGGGR